MRILPAQVLEGVQMPGGRETRLGAGDVEAGDLRRSRKAMHSSAISRDRAACRMAVSRIRARIGDRPSAAALVPAATPSSTACTTSVSARLRSVCSSGANRISAYTTPSAARSCTHSDATRINDSRVCITAVVCVKVSRYRSSEPE